MMSNTKIEHTELDSFTRELFDELFAPGVASSGVTQEEIAEMCNTLDKLKQTELTQPILDFFSRLLEFRRRQGILPQDLGLSNENLLALAKHHQEIDEHGVTVGGRINRALPIVEVANKRVKDYLLRKDAEAASGIELWDQIQENAVRALPWLQKNSRKIIRK